MIEVDAGPLVPHAHSSPASVTTSVWALPAATRHMLKKNLVGEVKDKI